MTRRGLLMIGLLIAFLALLAGAELCPPNSWRRDVLSGLAYAAAAGLVAVARAIEEDLPRCSVCGPMYGGRHHPECRCPAGTP